jgi:hypothetical protein
MINKKVKIASGLGASGSGADAEKAEADLSGGSPSPRPSPPGEGEGSSARGASCGKARSDSILSGLPTEQQAKIKQWLFEENQPFAGVAGRCKAELGVEVSKTSVIRYYRREASVRRLENSLWRRERRPDAAGNADEFYAELTATAGEMALESARGELDAEKRRTFVECTKLMISARREGNYARRVDLAREKFEFDAATACIIRQMEINSIIEDETLTDEERIRSVREELFGENLPE